MLGRFQSLIRFHFSEVPNSIHYENFQNEILEMIQLL